MCVCVWADSRALDFTDKHYLGLSGAPIFEWLNLVAGKSILNSTTTAGS